MYFLINTQIHLKNHALKLSLPGCDKNNLSGHNSFKQYQFMKLSLKSATLFTTCMLTIFSCKEPQTNQTVIQEELVKTEPFEFMGETAMIPSNFPRELFNQSLDDYRAYFHSLTSKNTARNNGEFATISYEDFNSIVVPHIKNYPDLSWEKEISDKDLGRIFKDFPELTTVEQVRERSEIVSAFYETFVKRDIIPDIAAFLEKAERGGRTTSGDVTYTSKPEMEYLLLHPVRASFYTAAGIMAKTTFVGADGTKTNAKQHAVWNCFAIRQIILGAAVSEDNALAFVRTATSHHELHNDWTQNTSHNTAMDLHNNMSAREWMKNETKWGIGPMRKMPTDAQIIDNMNAKGNSCAIHPINEILAWHGSINNQNEIQVVWNKLYNDLSSPNQHLVRISN
jgi:hypothetical protein